MIIIGVGFHPKFQQIAWVDTDSGELQERQLAHPEEAKKFYGARAAAGQQVRAWRPAGTLVPTAAGGVELRAMDWRRR